MCPPLHTGVAIVIADSGAATTVVGAASIHLVTREAVVPTTTVEREL